MYTPVRPSTRSRPASLLAATVVPARRQPLPPDEGVGGLLGGRKAGKERRLAVAGLEATLEEEDWPGRNLVGVRDGGGPSSAPELHRGRDQLVPGA